MATEVTCIVDVDGAQNPDYTSLSAAIAGETGASPVAVTSADLVANDEQLTIECRTSNGNADTADRGIVTGFTTNSTCYVHVYVPPAHRHRGYWDAARYRVEHTAGNRSVVSLVNDYSRLTGMQGRNKESYGTSAGVGLTGSNCQVGYCITRSAFGYAFNANGNYDAVVFNTLVVSSPSGFYSRRNTFYNCSACGEGAGYGFRFINTAGTAYNCLADGFASGDFASYDCTPDLYNCASTDGTADDFNGSNNRVDQTFTFVDAANGKYGLATNDAGGRNYGATNPGSGLYSDDIIGTARPQENAWDIGAFETIATSTLKSVTDAGAGSDALAQIAVALSLADTGSGAAAFGSLSAAVPIAEAASGNDAIAQIAALLALMDSGAGSDSLAQIAAALSLAEAGSGADAVAQIAALLSVADSGQGADTAQALILIAVSDAASGADALYAVSVSAPVADWGSASDAIASVNVTLSVADAASGADAPAVLAQFTVADYVYAVKNLSGVE